MPIIDERACPRCGEMTYSTTMIADNATCVGCSSPLKLPERVVMTTGAQWLAPSELEKGAQRIREIVEERKRRR